MSTLSFSEKMFGTTILDGDRALLAKKTYALLLISVVMASVGGYSCSHSEAMLSFFLRPVGWISALVLLNVIDNALKYGGQEVLVNIRAVASDKEVVITVSDNGPGIPPAYIGQVFEKFFRVPTQNLHNVKGYGLGLSYALVRLAPAIP
ncbi:MAG TPA: ATP-binding protein [Pseudomonadota bacterium]|nr:ATP-binding protein [Pseudomonadota bacterium]